MAQILDQRSIPVTARLSILYGRIVTIVAAAIGLAAIGYSLYLVSFPFWVYDTNGLVAAAFVYGIILLGVAVIWMLAVLVMIHTLWGKGRLLWLPVSILGLVAGVPNTLAVFVRVFLDERSVGEVSIIAYLGLGFTVAIFAIPPLIGPVLNQFCASEQLR